MRLTIRPSAFLLFAAVTAVGLTLPAQASFTTFGNGCALPNTRLPQIGNRGLPRIGTTLTVTYAGPNAIMPGIRLTDWPTLIAGASRIDFPVPPLTVSQPPGCTLYPAPDVVVPMPPERGGTRFVSEVALPIPNDPALLGGSVYLQWMTPHSQCYLVGCGFGWVVFSNAAHAVIGR